MACLASFIIALTLAGPSPGDAHQRLAVVSLSAPAQLTFLGKRTAEVVAEVAQRNGKFQVFGPEAVEKRLGHAKAKKLIECAGLARCAAERASLLEVDWIVSGVLAQTEQNYIVTVVLIDARTGKQVTSMTRDVPIASRHLLRDVALATPSLLKGEPDAVGTLVVLTDEPGADAEVDGQWEGKTPFTLSVKPGKHRVMVRQGGYIEQEPHWVDVSAREVLKDRVRLYPIPRRELNAGHVEVEGE